MSGTDHYRFQINFPFSDSIVEFMLLSNSVKFVQVQLRPMSLNSVLGKNHKITVEQLMLPFFFEEFETFIRAV